MVPGGGPGMSQRYDTIVLIPHARARFRRWRVSSRVLSLLLAALATLVTVSGFTTWRFITSSLDGAELERVRRENEEVRRINETFEHSIRGLESRLAEYEQRTRELAIVAGLENLAGTGEAGVGGDLAEALDSPGADLGPMAHRRRRLGAELARVEERLDANLRSISSTPAIAPVRGLLTSGFGYRQDPISGDRAAHWAIDIATAPNQPARATADGIVIRAGRSGGLGNMVEISHGYGVITRFGHLSRIAVRDGQRLRRGDLVGQVGTSGRSTGYHLHYEVLVDGKPVNPLGYILDTPQTGWPGP